MSGLFILIIVFSFFAIMMIVIKVSITLEYKLHGLDDEFYMIFSIFGGIIKYPYRSPEKKKKKEQDQKNKKEEVSFTKGIIERIINVKDTYESIVKIKVLLGKKIILKKMFLKIHFGTGDAYYTGILTGILWALGGSFFSILDSMFEVYEKELRIDPDFSQKKMNGDFYCIFQVKLVYIIVVLIKLKSFKLKDKKNKGGDFSGRASN